MKKFSIITLGCKVNQYESDMLAEQLTASGLSRTDSGEPADLVIVNTCTVTGKASMQSRQAVRQAIKSFPGAIIVVTGCYAQTAPSEIEKISGVHLIVGHADKHRIVELVQAAETDPALPCPAVVRRDVNQVRDFHFGQHPVMGSRTRQSLKIQDGCDAFCTYCIVPYARGRSRSMPPDAVLEHLNRLGEAGSREVVLTGIHLGSYGVDLDPKTSLDALLGRIDHSRPVRRLRLSSIEPQELTEEIIHRVATSDMFCPHFHLPLQSGDDGILQKMRRPYTGTLFGDIVNTIYRRMPDAALGVDILVGFPGETDDAFRRTYALIESLPIAYLHVFPFSPRPGTPASRYADKVKEKVIKKRCADIRKLGDEKKQAFYRRFIGVKLDVLIEDTRDSATGLLKGFSSNYVPVLIAGDDRLKNTVTAVQIDKIVDGRSMGTIRED